MFKPSRLAPTSTTKPLRSFFLRQTLQQNITRYRAFHATTARMTVHNIQSTEKWQETLKNNKVVFLDCFATWCGPCKALAPVISKFAEEAEYKEEIFFAKIDVDELPGVAQELGVRAMPTLFLFHNGAKVKEIVGNRPQILPELLKEGVAYAQGKKVEGAEGAGATAEL